MVARKGDWVRIYNIVLTSEERAPQVPEDTSKVPLEMWVKGFIIEDGKVGERVEVETVTGRRVAGELVEVDPCYDHSFGRNIPEILEIGKQLRGILFGGDC